MAVIKTVSLFYHNFLHHVFAMISGEANWLYVGDSYNDALVFKSLVLYL
jgi:hypothetical protein